MDINRKRIALTTGYQTRARKVVVLARLDFGASHRNPDGSEVGVLHLHPYREGYGDKWAVEVPAGILSNPADAWQVLLDFMRIWHTMPGDTESVRVRYDCGQQDTSGQEENRAHFCARFRK